MLVHVGPEDLSVGLSKVIVTKVADLGCMQNESCPNVEQAAFIIRSLSLEVYKYRSDDTCGLGISKD